MHYYNIQTNKGDEVLIFNKLEKKCRWHHHQKISKRNVKHVISPLSGHPHGYHGYQKKQKSSRNLNLLDFFATFKSKLNKIPKTTKIEEKTFKNDGLRAVCSKFIQF